LHDLQTVQIIPAIMLFHYMIEEKSYKFKKIISCYSSNAQCKLFCLSKGRAFEV